MAASRIPAGTRDIRSLDWLRMPLALCVIFIHSFGTLKVNFDNFTSGHWTWTPIYDATRIFLSHEFPIFAVPAFFLISGFLFFRHLEHWDWPTYGQKLRRRIHTILIPYIGWNLFHYIHLCWPTLMKIAHGTAHWDSLWRLSKALGGWHMFWTGSYNNTVVNCLGITMVKTAPVLVPLWFLRDLMIVLLFIPILHWLLLHGGRWFLALLGVCFILQVWIPLPGFSTEATFWFVLGGYFSINHCNMVDHFYQHRAWYWMLWPPLLVITTWLALYRPLADPYLRYILHSITTLAAVPAVIAIAATLQSRGWLHERQWLAKSAFWVYCSHIFFRKQVINATKSLVSTSSLSHLIYYFLVPILTLLVCIIVRQLYMGIVKKVRK